VRARGQAGAIEEEREIFASKDVAELSSLWRGE